MPKKDEGVDPSGIPDVVVDPEDEGGVRPDVDPLPDGVEEDPDLLVTIDRAARPDESEALATH